MPGVALAPRTLDRTWPWAQVEPLVLVARPVVERRARVVAMLAVGRPELVDPLAAGRPALAVVDLLVALRALVDLRAVS